MERFGIAALALSLAFLAGCAGAGMDGFDLGSDPPGLGQRAGLDLAAVAVVASELKADRVTRFDAGERDRAVLDLDHLARALAELRAAEGSGPFAHADAYAARLALYRAAADAIDVRRVAALVIAGVTAASVRHALPRAGKAAALARDLAALIKRARDGPEAATEAWQAMMARIQSNRERIAALPPD